MASRCFLLILIASLNCAYSYSQSAVSRSVADAGPQATVVQTHIDISPARAAKIEEMLALTGVKPKMLDANKKAKEEFEFYAHREVYILPQVTDADKPKLKEITDNYLAKQNNFAAQITWEKLEPSLLQFCASTYTQDEIEAIVAFYKSPAGTALLQNEKATGQAEIQAVKALQKEILPPAMQLTRDLKKDFETLHLMPFDATPPNFSPLQSKPAPLP